MFSFSSNNPATQAAPAHPPIEPDPSFKPLAPHGSIVQGPTYRITVLSPGLFRLEQSLSGFFEDRASTFAINRALETPEFQVIKDDVGGMEIVTERVRLGFDGGKFSGGGLMARLNSKLAGSSHGAEWRYGNPLKSHLENLGGTARTLDDIDGRIDLGEGVVSRTGFATIDDSATMLFTSEGWVAPRIPDRIDIYLFCYGSEYREALKAYFQLSGRQPVIPRWALGNWWSRYHHYKGEDYLALMDRFKKEDIPLSVAVLDMDWHLTSIPSEYGSPWTGYTWDKELFPDHVEFMKQLHDRNLKITLNTHPADGVRAFEDLYPAMCKALGVDPKTKQPINFDAPSRKFMEAYFNTLSHSLEDEGIDFWWLDWQQGNLTKVPGIDPLWILNHYHFHDSDRRLGRKMTFSRYAGPGSHRYPIGFSGDTHITWDSLHFQPEFTATAANVGYGWWSHDIGGHTFGKRDDELTARWTQLGIWSPILRLHCTDSPYLTREPWRFSPRCYASMVHSLRFRQQLIPYLYTMAIRATLDGRSLVEPLYYDYPGNENAYRNKNQFWFGSQLMVSPITQPADTETTMGRVETWLPDGTWVDIFAGVVYEGDRVIPMFRQLEDVPVLAKPGAIIPLDNSHIEKGTQNGAPLPVALSVILVVGADGSFELLEDDGTAPEVDGITFTKTPIKYTQSTGEVVIGPTTDPLVKSRTWSIVLPSFTVSEGSISSSAGKVEVGTQGGITTLSITSSVSTTKALTISLGADPQLAKNDVLGKIDGILREAGILHNTKRDIYALIEGDLKAGKSLGIRLGRLRTATEGLSEVMREALEEHLLAQA